MLIGSTNVPNSIINNTEFRSLIKVLGSKYLPPGITLMSKERDDVLVLLEQSVQGFTSEA